MARNAQSTVLNHIYMRTNISKPSNTKNLNLPLQLWLSCEAFSTTICSYRATKPISEVGHWCWVIKPGSQSVFQFISKVLDGVAVGDLCRLVKLFQHNLKPISSYAPSSVHGVTGTSKHEEACPANCCHKTLLSKISPYAGILRFPLTKTKKYTSK